MQRDSLLPANTPSQNLTPIKDESLVLKKSQLPDEITTTIASVSSSMSSLDSSLADDVATNKNADLDKKSDKHGDHHRKSEKAHKKVKKLSKNKSQEEKLHKCAKDSRIRRSDRIKVIETKKQHHKELEIAEKIKKHSSNLSNHHQDSNSNEPLDESLAGQMEAQKIEDTDTQQDPTTKAPNEIDRLPVKIKDRWRRYSEKEYENSNLSPSLLYLTPPQTTQINVNSPSTSSSKFDVMTTNSQASVSSFSVTSNFDSSNNSPHRAFKKILLDKAVHETNHSSSTLSNVESKSIHIAEQNFDMSVLKDLYEHIDENFYATKRYFPNI